MSSEKKRVAMIAGASGLVGSLCLRELLANERYGAVLAIVRSPLDVKHEKLREIVVDFSRPETFAGLRADDVYSCLGTTRAKTPSEADYRRIDFDIPLSVARAALDRGAARLLLVSSVGADPRSRAFYTRLKGELETAAASLPFEAVHVFRPSFLVGERRESRPLERFFLAAMPFASRALVGPARKYRAIAAATVAKAMVRAALSETEGLKVYEYDAIRDLGL